jgi:hypothetical protein
MNRFIIFSLGLVAIPSLTPGPASPCLGYRMYLFQAGKAEINSNPYLYETCF